MVIKAEVEVVPMEPIANIEEAKRWYSIACEYLYLEEHDVTHPLAQIEYRPGASFYMLPSKTVRLALIIELLLKSLLAFEKKDIEHDYHNHHLEKLFGGLEKDVRQELENVLRERYPKATADVSASLQQCSNCFVDIRYHGIDGKNGYTSYWPILRRFAAVLDDYVYSLLYKNDYSDQ